MHHRALPYTLTLEALEILLTENVRGRVATTAQMPRVRFLSLKEESIR